MIFTKAVSILMNDGKYPFEFQEGNETRRLPERKRPAQIALFANHGIAHQMEGFKHSELGYGEKPTCRQFQILMQKYENFM